MNSGQLRQHGVRDNQRQVMDEHCTTEWAERVATGWADEEDFGSRQAAREWKATKATHRRTRKSPSGATAAEPHARAVGRCSPRGRSRPRQGSVGPDFGTERARLRLLNRINRLGARGTASVAICARRIVEAEPSRLWGNYRENITDMRAFERVIGRIAFVVDGAAGIFLAIITTLTFH